MSVVPMSVALQGIANMIKHLIGLLLVTSCVLPANIVDAAHRFVIQGNNRLAIVGEDGRVEWEMPWGAIHDVHALANGNFMVQQGPSKIVEIDRAARKVVWTYDSAAANGNERRKVEVH